jgi:hypothetical protein
VRRVGGGQSEASKRRGGGRRGGHFGRKTEPGNFFKRAESADVVL